MGDTQSVPWQELLPLARERFDAADDLTLAVEEEFAILDPETLLMVNRFEEIQAAAQGTELEEALAGELIASEVEVRTGRCETFAEAAARLGERRAQLYSAVGALGATLGATGTHPWARWQDQRIIDTPHYRRNDEILRYVVWRNNSFGLHVHVAINGADRAIAVCNALRNYLPELLALSASSPFVEDVNTGLHSARTQIFTRMFPRCGIPDVYDGWAGFERYVSFLYETALDRRAHAALVERPSAPRLPDGRDPHLRRAARSRRGGGALGAPYSLTARIARAIDEGEPLPRGRTGCSRRTSGVRSARPPRRLIDLGGARSCRPARGSSGCSNGCSRSPTSSARRPTSTCPRRTRPSASSRGTQEVATLREIYAEQVAAGEPVRD